MSTPSTYMGLTKWDAGGDYFSYSELSANWDLVDLHDHTSGKGLQIPTGGLANLAVTNAKLASGSVDVVKLADNAVETAKIKDANVTAAKLASDSVTTAKITDANVTAAKLDASLAGYLGTSDSVIRRGKSIISTVETRNTNSYATLATPDHVQNIVLPTDGIIFVAYKASWKEDSTGIAAAAIFLNATQLTYTQAGIANANQSAAIGTAGAVNNYVSLSSGPIGLHSLSGLAYSAAATDVTTGQVIGGGIETAGGGSTTQGGPVAIFAAAGTYTVSVQYKANGGTLTAKDRKLWVWTTGF